METDGTEMRYTEMECKEMDNTYKIKLIDMTHTIITKVSNLVFNNISV